MWSDFAAWFTSAEGQRVLSGTVLPAAAILVAGLIAGIVARAAVRRVERRLDQDALTAAVAGFVEAARRTASGDPDTDSTSRLASVSDVRMRLVGRSGADLAAQWAYAVSLQARPDDVGVVRDRLVAWTARPSRAKRLFAADLAALAAPAAAAAPARLERPARVEPVAQTSRPEPAPEPAPATGGVPVERVRRHAEPEPAPAAGGVPVERTPHQAEPEQAAAAPLEQELGLATAMLAPVEDPQAAGVPDRTEVPAARVAAAAGVEQEKPAWLDDYDDEAHVTRNIPLGTPSPVPATSVRDRNRPGDNTIVPG